MRTFFILWRKELAQFFLTPMAYVLAALFLFIMGMGFWGWVYTVSEQAKGENIMQQLFATISFWIPVLAIVPMLTMRLLAEERRSGTLEALLTAPVTETQVVLAKYAAVLCFYALMWLPTALFPLLLRSFNPLSLPPDAGAVFGGYLGALLIGALFLAAGVLCSAIARSQVVSAVACFALLCALFFAGFTPYLARAPRLVHFGEYISCFYFMTELARGVVDTRSVVFCLSGAALLLFAAVCALQTRRTR